MFGMALDLLLGARAASGVVVPLLEPSSQWDGTAGTGFGGSNPAAPTDPTRTTAKPTLHLLDPPNQFFTDELTISVLAFANDGGTLIGGIDRVRFWFEGNSVEVEAPALRAFTRYDGSAYSLPCYTVTLKKPASTAGTANVVIEAIPADATMQKRVLTVQFSPVATKHDWTATVGTGGDYADPTTAAIAARTALAQNPLITFISSGTYSLGVTGGTYQVQGYLHFRCAEGVEVTFGKASYVNDAGLVMRTRFDGMWFEGEGFTFNHDYFSEIFHDAQLSNPYAVARSHVFNRVRFLRTLPVGSLTRKILPNNVLACVRGSAYVMDCEGVNVYTICASPMLSRGCIFEGGWGDVFSGAACAVGYVVKGWSSAPYREPVAAMTVQYTGAGATADLSLTGISGSNNRTFTARVDGGVVGTFTVQNTEAAFLAGTNYNVQNVADWINGLADWTATVQDDTRNATWLNALVNVFGAFTNLDVKAAPLQLYANLDLHTDLAQVGPRTQNVLHYGARIYGFDGASLQWGGALQDHFALNVALDIDSGSWEDPTGAAYPLNLNGVQSHVALAHVTLARSALLLRTDSSYNPDAYCLVSNNSVRELRWQGAADPSITPSNNHLHAGSVGIPGSPGEVKAGDADTLYVNHEIGDFTPAGELATNPRTSLWSWDLNGSARGATSRPGAVA